MPTATKDMQAVEVVERDDVVRGGRVRLRAAQEDGVGSRAAGGNQRFGGVAYAGNVVTRWFGQLVIDLAGIEYPEDQVTPVLFMHCGEETFGGGRVGVTDSIAVTPNGLEIGGRFLRDENPRVAEVKRDMEAGYPWELSVGVDRLETVELEPGQTRLVNGREVVGPAMVMTRSRLREVSIVDIGADYETEVAMLRKGHEMAKRGTTAGKAAGGDGIDWTKVTAEGLRAHRPDIRLADDPPADPSPEDEKEKDKPEGEEGLEEEAEPKGGKDKPADSSGDEKKPEEGLEEEAEPEGGKDKPAEESESMNAKPATPPATLAELKALKGATGDFIVECLDGNLSIVQATSKLNEALYAQVEQAKREGKLRDEAAGAKAVPAAEGGGKGGSAGGGGAGERLKFTDKAQAEAAWADNAALRAYFTRGTSEKAGRNAFLRAVEQTLSKDGEFSITLSAA